MTPFSYHSSNLSLTAVETMRLLVQTHMEEAIKLCFLKKKMYSLLISNHSSQKYLVKIFLSSRNLLNKNIGWTSVEYAKCNNFQISQKTEI